MIGIIDRQTTQGKHHSRIQWALQLEQNINSLQGRQKIYFLTGFMTILLAFHLYGAYQHLYERNIGARNTGYQKNDQEDYMLYAKALYFSDYQYAGDGNRMPLYPALQSLHYSPTISMEDYFVQGKYFNIALSVILLISLFLIFLQHLPTLAAINLMLITTFQLYVFRAAYFQAELLYYFLSFCTFVLMLHLFKQQTWKLAILTGSVAGLAHLTKASMLPAFLLCLVVLALKTAIVFWQERHLKSKLLWMYLAAGLWVVVAFLVTLYPQISRAKATFGHYFYNVNTTFYIWYDDKAEIEARTSTKAHGDSVGWPDLPNDQLPSLQKYLRETSPKEFLDRMAFGVKMNFKRHILPGSYGYSPYIVGYPLVALTFIILTYRDKMIRQELWQLFRQQRFTTLYILLYLSCYIVLYSFYMRISGGQRFMLALFLPLMFSTTKAMNLSIFHSRQIQVDGMKIPLISIFNLSLVPILVVHALYNVLWVVDDFYAGD